MKKFNKLLVLLLCLTSLAYQALLAPPRGDNELTTPRTGPAVRMTRTQQLRTAGHAYLKPRTPRTGTLQAKEATGSKFERTTGTLNVSRTEEEAPIITLPSETEEETASSSNDTMLAAETYSEDALESRFQRAVEAEQSRQHRDRDDEKRADLAGQLLAEAEEEHTHMQDQLATARAEQNAIVQAAVAQRKVKQTLQADKVKQKALYETKLAEKRAAIAERKRLQQTDVTITWNDDSSLKDFEQQLHKNITTFKGIDLPGNAFRLIAEHCPNLVTLDLSGNHNLIADDIDRFVESCKKLSTLNVSGCHHVDWEFMRELNKSKSLTTLVMAGCIDVYDIGFELLSKSTSLETVDLTNCTQLVDEDVEILAQMKQLKTVIIAGCKNISERAKQQLEARNITVVGWQQTSEEVEAATQDSKNGSLFNNITSYFWGDDN